MTKKVFFLQAFEEIKLEDALSAETLAAVNKDLEAHESKPRIDVVSDGTRWVRKTAFDSERESRKSLETTISERDQQLEDFNKELGKFKDRNEDVTKLQEQIDTLKTENQNAETKRVADLEAKDKEYAVDLALAYAKPKSERSAKAVKSLIDMDQVTLESDGTVKGLDSQIEALKNDEPHFFEAETTTRTSGSGNKTKNDPSGGSGSGVTQKDFNDMDYGQRIELYNNDPELYSQLAGHE